jgi:hypothetical protein
MAALADEGADRAGEAGIRWKYEAPGNQAPGRFVLLIPLSDFYSSSSTSAAASAGAGTGSSTRGGGASKPAGGWMSISA